MALLRLTFCSLKSQDVEFDRDLCTSEVVTKAVMCLICFVRHRLVSMARWMLRKEKDYFARCHGRNTLGSNVPGFFLLSVQPPSVTSRGSHKQSFENFYVFKASKKKLYQNHLEQSILLCYYKLLNLH